MKYLTILIMLSLNACATAHQYCLAHADEYKDYDECYSERVARKAALRQSMSHIGDGMANAAGKRCTTDGNSVSCN